MSENTKRKVAACLDDEAFKVGDFIQELGKIQDQYFDALWEKVKANDWVEGFESDETAKDWLFDYVFNGWQEKSEDRFDQSFSEYCNAEWKE